MNNLYVVFSYRDGKSVRVREVSSQSKRDAVEAAFPKDVGEIDIHYSVFGPYRVPVRGEREHLRDISFMRVPEGLSEIELVSVRNNEMDKLFGIQDKS